MVAPMFITFSLHWLFCYLFLCDLRHIYHLPINLTVVRIKVIKVIKLMQGYLMHALRTSCQITQAALPMLAFMFVNVMFSGGPLSALTCCVNVRLLSAIKKISPLIYSQSWVGSWVYSTQAMMTFTLIFYHGCIPSRIAL